VNIEVEIGPHAWCFVHDVDLVRPRLYERVIYPYRNVTLLRTTRNVTSYTVVNRRIVNRGVPIVQVEQRAGIRVPKYQTVEVRSPRERRTVRGDAVAVVRPDFQQITQQRTTIQRRSSITTDRDVQRVPSTEIIRRQDDDLRRLESRHRVQQREFDDGLRRDLDGARDQSTAERTRQQREAERRALTDQQSRERRLIERQYDRERRGQVQPPRPDARRYRLDDADRARPEKDRARSGGRIEKQRKDD
jgi:hypothetical protein